MNESKPSRFTTLQAVAHELDTSTSQVYALVRSGDLPAIKMGGRGQWRVERSVLEDYIQRMYAETAAFVQSHPFGEESRGSSTGSSKNAVTGSKRDS